MRTIAGCGRKIISVYMYHKLFDYKRKYVRKRIKMRLSKYVLRIPMESNNNVIYFNRANGSIILLSESADKLVLGGQ